MGEWREAEEEKVKKKRKEEEEKLESCREKGSFIPKLPRSERLLSNGCGE